MADSKGMIHGTVNVSSSGVSPANIEVVVESTSARFSRNVRTDSTGHFEVQGLPPGAYRVSIQESGYEPVSTTTIVDRDSAPISLDLRLSESSAAVSSGGTTVSLHELKIPAKARALFRKGAEHLNAEDPGGSLPFFEQAIHKFPNYYEAYYNLGLAQIRLGRTQEAARSFQSAIDASAGKFPWAEFAYGLILCQQGNIDEAERLVRAGLAQDQSTPEGYVALGTVMLYRHKPDEAELSVREALTRNPRFPQAYLILAEAHRQRKDYSAEVQDLNTYMSLEPKGAHRDFAGEILTAARREAAETGNQPQQ